MELLTRLSPEPMPAAALARDLLVTQPELVQLVASLRTLGFVVIQGCVLGVRCFWISESGWRSAERAAQGFWNRTQRGRPRLRAAAGAGWDRTATA